MQSLSSADFSSRHSRNRFSRHYAGKQVGNGVYLFLFSFNIFFQDFTYAMQLLCLPLVNSARNSKFPGPNQRKRAIT